MSVFVAALAAVGVAAPTVTDVATATTATTSSSSGPSYSILFSTVLQQAPVTVNHQFHVHLPHGPTPHLSATKPEAASRCPAVPYVFSSHLRLDQVPSCGKFVTVTNCETPRFRVHVEQEVLKAAAAAPSAQASK